MCIRDRAYLAGFNGGGGDYRAAFDPAEAINTYLLQLTGILPHNLFPEERNFRLYANFVRLFGATALIGPISGAAACAAAVFVSLKNLLGRAERQIPRVCVWCGVFLTALFFAPLAVSAKHQAEITWGAPYLPVYLQFFGAAILLLPALQRVPRLGAAAVALVCFFNTAANLAAAGLNLETNRPRRILEEAFEGGLLDQAPKRAFLAARVTGCPPDSARFYNRGNFFTDEFIRAYSGRDLRAAQVKASIHAPFGPRLDAAPCEIWVDLRHNRARLEKCNRVLS